MLIALAGLRLTALLPRRRPAAAALQRCHLRAVRDLETTCHQGLQRVSASISTVYNLLMPHSLHSVEPVFAGTITIYEGPVAGIPDEHASRRERFAELDELQPGWIVKLSSKADGGTVDATFTSPGGALTPTSHACCATP